MIKPKALRPGDTIGIISPASPIEEKYKDSFDKGVNVLKNLGYNIKIGRHALKQNGYLAGSDEQRASDLMEMFMDKNINAIICSRGGYGSERLLRYLDFETIAKNPKIFAGYSNISILLNIFSQYAGFITFHSPMIINFDGSSDEYNTKNFINTISLYQSKFVLGKKAEGKCQSKYRYKASGPLLGGNLTTIIGTIGTKYEIKTENSILFLEEVNEQAYSIDRMLTLLKNTGKLELCRGFILGDFTNCLDSSGKSIRDVINDIIIPLGKPVILSFRCGHGPIKATLPFGTTVEINTRTGIATALETVISR